MAASALALASCNGGEPAAGDGETYIQARTVQQMMANVVQPTAEHFWNSVRYVSDETGDHEYIPVTDEDWRDTRTAAASLSEMGNLLMTPVYAEGRGDDWTDFARGLVEVGNRAEQAAIDKDVDAVFEVGGTVYNVCTACHQAYPAEELPASVTEEELRPTTGVSLEEYTN